MYPVLFLPFFLLQLFFQKKNIVPYLLSFFLPISITIAPFLADKTFLTSFFGSGLTQKIVEAKINTIPLFPVIYTIILFVTSRKPFSYRFSLVGLLFLVLVSLHPQWIIWFLPFFLLSFNSKLSKFIFFLIATLTLGHISLINDQFLTWGHLIPIDPDFLSLTTPHDFVKFRFSQPPIIIQQYIKTIIGFLSLILLFITWRHDQTNS
jgi:hypothetical protein